MKNYFLMLFSIISFSTIQSQSVLDEKQPKYPTTPWTKENVTNKKPIPYTNLREADVMWSKRIWRVIDLREKINHPLYYPETPIADRKSLFDVIKDKALKGELTTFGNPLMDDEFRYDLTVTEFNQLIYTIDSIDVQDPNDPDTYIRKADIKEITSADVWKYWVKEDWFFDKQKSVMEVRIIGICPVIEKKDQNGNGLGADKPLFWIYFPETRPILANSEVYMRKNDAQRLSLDDLFWKRMFSSFVRKESNVYDRIIFDYKQGLDVLLEAEKIKNDIFIYEHDLWHF